MNKRLRKNEKIEVNPTEVLEKLKKLAKNHKQNLDLKLKEISLLLQTNSEEQILSSYGSIQEILSAELEKQECLDKIFALKNQGIEELMKAHDKVPTLFISEAKTEEFLKVTKQLLEFLFEAKKFEKHAEISCSLLELEVFRKKKQNPE